MRNKREGKNVEKEVSEGLVANSNAECTEIGMYLAMAKATDREGYPKISAAFTKYAFEETEHAAKFAELLGEVISDSTKKNLQMRADAEHGACEGKFELAKLAKQLLSMIRFIKWQRTKQDTVQVL